MVRWGKKEDGRRQSMGLARTLAWYCGNRIRTVYIEHRALICSIEKL